MSNWYRTKIVRLFAYLFLIWISVLFYELTKYRTLFGTGANSLVTMEEYSNFTKIIGLFFFICSFFLFVKDFLLFYKQKLIVYFSFLILSYGTFATIHTHLPFEYLHPFISLICFYLISSKKIISPHIISIWIILIILSLSYPYIIAVGKIQQTAASNNMELTTNGSYIFSALLPMVLLLKRSFLKYLMILVVLALVSYSLKRTAFLGCVISIIFYIICSNNKKISQTIIRLLFLIIISITILIPIIQDYVPDLYNRFVGISEDKGSGRTVIWSILINNLFNRDIVTLIFGTGFRSTVDITRVASAHNEFLELLIDFGLLYFVMYSFIHFYLFRISLKLIHKGFQPQLLSSAVVFLVVAMFSHWVDFGFLSGLTTFWGYYLGLLNRKKLYYENRYFDI